MNKYKTEDILEFSKKLNRIFYALEKTAQRFSCIEIGENAIEYVLNEIENEIKDIRGKVNSK